MFEMDDGSVQVFFRGTFAQDKERAARVGSEAIDLFCQENHIPHPKVAAHCALALPPGLRKGLTR